MNSYISLNNIVIVCLLAMLVGCDASPTARVSSLKLSSEELGTKEHISRILNSANRDVKKINDLVSKAENAESQQNYGIANSYYKIIKLR